MAEVGATGALNTRYIRGTGLVAREVDSALQYYLFDAHGDVLHRLDASGNLLKTYRYDAFGNEIDPEPLDTNPFRYCGEYFDREIGTYYLRARNYDPRTGRLTTEDTVHAAKINLFNSIEDCSDVELSGGVFRGYHTGSKEFDLDFPIYPTGTDNQKSQTRSRYGWLSAPVYVVEDALSLNLYSYAKNNPLYNTDPTGNNALALWSTSMWWLTLADGPLPIGDIIYLGGAIIAGIITGIGLYLAVEHTKRRGSKAKTNDKHTKPRPGRGSEKKKLGPGWRPNPNKPK